MNYLNSDKKILFVYINEDYIYSEEYREACEKNYEDLKKLNDYLMITYPKLDFTIFAEWSTASR